MIILIPRVTHTQRNCIRSSNVGDCVNASNYANTSDYTNVSDYANIVNY